VGRRFDGLICGWIYWTGCELAFCFVRRGEVKIPQ